MPRLYQFDCRIIASGTLDATDWRKRAFETLIETARFFLSSRHALCALLCRSVLTVTPLPSCSTTLRTGSQLRSSDLLEGTAQQHQSGEPDRRPALRFEDHWQRGGSGFPPDGPRFPIASKATEPGSSRLNPRVERTARRSSVSRAAGRLRRSSISEMQTEPPAFSTVNVSQCNNGEFRHCLKLYPAFKMMLFAVLPATRNCLEGRPHDAGTALWR
jgi:hypothetical protein